MIVNLIRSKEFQIVVGLPFDKCTYYDILMWFFYFGACLTITIVAIKRNNFEQNLKIKYGRGICKSDLRFAPSIVRRLVIVGFLGGWVSGALGLGGGAIFNPVLLSMGIPASVSGSTGMYLVMFTTLGQSVTYILLGQLNFSYALWISAWCILGTYMGMRLLDWLMKKYNRQSFIIYLLSAILGISAVLTVLLGSKDMLDQLDKGQGDKIFEFNFAGIC